MAEDDPDNELGHFRLGQLLMEAGNDADAARSFQRTLVLSPAFSKVYQLLAQCQIEARTGATRRSARSKKGYKIADQRGDKMPRDEMAKMLRESGRGSAGRQAAGTRRRPAAFPCRRPGCVAGGYGKPLAATADSGRDWATDPAANLRRLLERLASQLQHQGHQRTAARPEHGTRPGRVRQIHARLLRIRIMTCTTSEYLVHHGVAGHLGPVPRRSATGQFTRGAHGRRSRPARTGTGRTSCCCRPANGPARPTNSSANCCDRRPRDDLDAVDRRIVRSASGCSTTPCSVLNVRGADFALSTSKSRSTVGRPCCTSCGSRPATSDPLLAELGEEHGVIVRLYEVNGTDRGGRARLRLVRIRRAAAAPCGAGRLLELLQRRRGNELAAYFAELRRQMENRNRVAVAL